jgi:hypothetical protein
MALGKAPTHAPSRVSNHVNGAKQFSYRAQIGFNGTPGRLLSSIKAPPGHSVEGNFMRQTLIS